MQKATELGAAALLPVLTARSNTTRVNRERLRAIAIEAAEQCERLTVPDIRPPQALARPAAALAAEPAACSSPPNAPTHRTCARHRARPGCWWARKAASPPAELDALRRCAFVAQASLGPRILRAETACLAGLTLLQVPGCG